MGTGHNDLLQSILRSNDWFMAVLRAARAADLPEWFVGAGAVRSTVWDSLHGYTVPTPLTDVDVAFFDPRDLTPARDAAATALLLAHGPGLPWEATNQAAVHLWYPTVFGAVVAPVFSSDEAIGTWPETATCVGVRLLGDDSLVVATPHGLDDLLTMVLRHNPQRATVELFHHRLQSKRIRETWPHVQVIAL